MWERGWATLDAGKEGRHHEDYMTTEVQHYIAVSIGLSTPHKSHRVDLALTILSVKQIPLC
jgi:hypothetical protein